MAFVLETGTTSGAVLAGAHCRVNVIGQTAPVQLVSQGVVHALVKVSLPFHVMSEVEKAWMTGILEPQFSLQIRRGGTN